jgi:hypothetical protein
MKQPNKCHKKGVEKKEQSAGKKKKNGTDILYLLI